MKINQFIDDTTLNNSFWKTKIDKRVISKLALHLTRGIKKVHTIYFTIDLHWQIKCQNFYFAPGYK